MTETRLRQIRRRTGHTAYAFGKELERRGVVEFNHYLKIERGNVKSPSREIEDGITHMLAETLGITFNEALLELRGAENREAVPA